MCKCNGESVFFFFFDKRNDESVDHLYLNFPIASYLWSMVLCLFGVYWVISKSVVKLLPCWQCQFHCHWNDYIWMDIPHCLMWCIWRERNSRSFEDIERTTPDLKLFLFTLLDWLFSVVDLLDLCNVCN